MKLYDIVKQSTFKISRNQSDVIESFYSVISMLTGQYVSQSNSDKKYCDLIYKLVQKYIKRKFNKDNFLKLEQAWLETQKLNVWKLFLWMDRHTDRHTNSADRTDRRTYIIQTDRLADWQTDKLTD